VVLVVSVTLPVMGALVYWQWAGAVMSHPPIDPPLDSIRSYRLPETPHVTDREEELVAHLEDPVRVWTPLDSVSPWIRDGVIAVEDRSFWDHGGVDLKGVARATVRNLRNWTVLEGASTISMQLARNLWWERAGDLGRWRRKLLEVRLARELEARLSKEEILELYLNRIFWGRGVYGIGAASIHYFGKDPSELTLPEAATLVATIKTPNRYNPRAFPERSTKRRNQVLEEMVRVGSLDTASAREAKSTPLEVVESPPLRRGRSYYLDAVETRLEEIIPNPSRRHGVWVYTAWDTSAQRIAEDRLREQIRAIEAGELGSYTGPVPPDSLGQATGGASPYLQGAVVVLDQRTGEVRALVGGRDFHHSRFNRALEARRQPGSAFKPMIYASAIEARHVTLSSWIDTGPIDLAKIGNEGERERWGERGLEGDPGRDREGADEEGEEEEEAWNPAERTDSDSLDVRTALYTSSNRAAVRVGMRTGVGRVLGLARRVGIQVPAQRYPSFLLGSFSTTPLELAAAYTPFGNGGYRVHPRIILRIEDRLGQVLYRAPSRNRRKVLDSSVAFLVRSALEDVVTRGTGWRIRRDGYHGPAAGKTGTTDGARDAWFVGLTDELTISVWMGFDSPKPLSNGSGGLYAAPVWGRIAQDLGGERREIPSSWQELPDGISRVRLDLRTGFAVPEGCDAVKPDTTRNEYFLEGTEPSAICPCTDGSPVCPTVFPALPDTEIIKTSTFPDTAMSRDGERGGENGGRREGSRE
jgi:penicillin-binding protein 1A